MNCLTTTNTQIELFGNGNKNMGNYDDRSLWSVDLQMKQLWTNLCLVRGILTQFAEATAIKGTQRARSGGAVCKKW